MEVVGLKWVVALVEAVPLLTVVQKLQILQEVVEVLVEVPNLQLHLVVHHKIHMEKDYYQMVV